MSRWLLLLGAVALLAACEEASDQGMTAVPNSEVASPMEAKPMLPAWRTAAEKKLGKGDEYSDYKDDHPEIYGITNPPNKPGFRPVAEWEDTQAMLMTWSSTSLPADVKKTLANTIKGGADVVDVYVVVGGSGAQNDCTNQLKNVGMAQATIDAKVHYLTMENDSIWMRDYGPVPLISADNVEAFADLRYYPNRIYDDKIPHELAELWGVTAYKVPLDYEGGNFASDTKGNCFASTGLLQFNGVSQAAIEGYMKDYMGCQKLYFLDPIEDGTTHIDMFSKLAPNNVYVLGKCTTSKCSQTTINTLEKDNTYLQGLVLSDGSKLTIYRIPMPNQKDGVWRTYTNSLFVNNVNLIPIYSIDKDLEAEAMTVWETAMPTWTHAGILSDVVITWGGAQHCVTMTVGAGTFAQWEAAPAYACEGDWACYPGQVTPEKTCEGKCGGQGIGGCWCDDQCKQYGDCCPDYDELCAGPCTPNCTGKECGSDGCGGSCGTCPAGLACQAGKCVESTGPVVDECLGNQEPSANDCQGVTYEGCCDASGRLFYCDGGLFCIDCAAGGPQCGWDAQNSFYNCGTDGSEDPSGENPLNCTGGGPCTPSCAGKECGSDGCGGQCGTCPAGQTCSAGKCGTQTDPCQGISFEGCCDGETLKYCENEKLNEVDCSQKPSCGWQSQGPFYDCQTDGAADPSGTHPKECPAPCQPQCAGKECGDDGCGGSCGTCPAGKGCVNGKCGDCTPACAGKQCGDDGCGGSCGTCPAGKTCKAGLCSDCQPSCAGKSCGDDGCGGSCGTCPAGNNCTNGTCTPVCVPSCVGKNCGDDGCGGTCGTCPAGANCTNGVCVAACVPNCAGKQCGDDGCSGTCGTCGADQVCNTAGLCIPACKPACVGKACGDDGCGGSCGTCGAGFACDQGLCAAETPPDKCGAGEEWDGSKCVIVTEPGSEGGGCAVGERAGVPAGGAGALALLILAFFGLSRRVLSRPR